MISHWRVIQQVADRFGDRQSMFEESERALNEVKEGKLPLVSLEKDQERIRKRLLRESSSGPITLERINGITNFQDKNVLDKLSIMAKAVCRLLKNGSPIGTGFLIADDILITNHHVIESSADASTMLAEFDFELDINQVPKKSACFKLNASKFFLTSSLEEIPNDLNSGLDFTMIGLDSVGIAGESLSTYPPISLDGNLGKIIKGESCVIIQHPNGLPKKVVLKDISFFSETGTRLVYESDTLPGSSGSMVVALGTCEVIALHHSGLPRTDAQNQILTKAGTIATSSTPDDEIDWIGNEGIKVSVIVQALRDAVLPAGMQNSRDVLLRKTKLVAQQLIQGSRDGEVSKVIATIARDAQRDAQLNTVLLPTNTALPKPVMTVSTASPAQGNAKFLITAQNKLSTINQIERVLTTIYGSAAKILLSMPASAVEGEVELFSLELPITGNASEEISTLLKIPGIMNAEADTPLLLNTGPDMPSEQSIRAFGTESNLLPNSVTSKWDEDDFLKDYPKSPYVLGKTPTEFRKWNWQATGFDKFTLAPADSPTQCGIRVVQFDTGFTNHSKVVGGYDLDQDHNFLGTEDPTNAQDPLAQGLGRQPGHGTRTGSLLIGHRDHKVTNPNREQDHDGNCGLLTPYDFKLIPYRIAQSVILIDRQQELAAALDRAISQGIDIITMSMGLPPTIATAKMAKKAYEKGIIWCCASGNEVKAVVAPAVFPGAIAVAASNPMDEAWTGSSRGSTIAITAPGQDVYVPILNENLVDDFAYGNGTSYSTPHVAAAAACWLAKYRNTLSDPAYGGWKRVEAFRDALKRSARTKHHLPHGFGAGILDINALMATPPAKAQALENAYNGFNENAFFATLQGVGEIAKTLWNVVHDKLFGNQQGAEESLRGAEFRLSPFSQQLEKALFPTASSSVESIETISTETALKRFQALHSLIEQSAK